MKINFKNIFNTIKKSLEKSTSIIANLCQILIVVLAIFEYQKNIKPSFQNQLLAEENARLELDNMKLEEDSRKIKELLDVQVSTKQNELELLQSKFEDINSRYEIATKKLQAIESEQRQKEDELKRIVEKQNRIDSLDDFKKRILANCEVSRSRLIFNESIEIMSDTSSGKERDKTKSSYFYPLENIDKLISSYFYNPYIYIYKSLDIIQSENINGEDKQVAGYIMLFKKIISEKEKYIIFDEKRVYDVKKKLEELNLQLQKLHTQTKKDYLVNIEIFNKEMKIQNEARDLVSQLDKELITYESILTPVMNEMKAYYLEGK